MLNFGGVSKRYFLNSLRIHLGRDYFILPKFITEKKTDGNTFRIQKDLRQDQRLFVVDCGVSMGKKNGTFCGLEISLLFFFSATTRH